jgi:hypothetical protein
MGMKGKGSYTASVTDYKVVKNPNIDHSVLAKINGDVAEINSLLAKKKASKTDKSKPLSKNQKKIDKLLDKEEMTNTDMRRLNRLMKKETVKRVAPKPLEIKPRKKLAKVKIKNDSSYWARLRPVKLTKEEKLGFVDKDSLELIIHTPEYKDSIISAQKKFKPSHLLWGKTYVYKKDSARFSSTFETPAALGLMNLSFNTVDGVNMDFPFKYTLRDTMGKQFEVYNKFNYAYEREALSFETYIYFLFNGRKKSYVQIGGGIHSSDYKNGDAASSMENMYYSLYAEKNFIKFYEKRDAYIQYSTEISNGLSVIAQLSYENRLPLENNSKLKFINVKDREYTDNIIENTSLKPWQYGQSESHTATIKLRYTPRQFHRYRKNVKQYVRSDYPTFSLMYTKAFSSFGADADYDYIKANIKQSLSVLDNNLEYSMTVGKYLTADKLYAQDAKLFKSSIESISLTNNFTKFRSLAYYEPISTDYYMEAHAKYSMSRFLLKRLPFFNDKLLMQESLYVSYLNTESLKHYFEIGYGINNIFLLLDAEIVAGFREGEVDYVGLKFNIKLNQN